jgi:hypothetical protein
MPPDRTPDTGLPSEEAVEKKKVHRFNVNFSEGAYRDLATLAERKGTTMAEILRHAIALLRWFEEARLRGDRILVERNGVTQEVIWR